VGDRLAGGLGDRQRARGQHRKQGRGTVDEWARAAQSWAAWFDLIRIEIQTNSNTIQIISIFD
jgi:hypothetical protein